MKPNLIKLEQLVKSKKAILVNNKFIKRTLGYDDMRDFCEELHYWGHARNFLYQTTQDDWQRFLKLFIKERFLD